MDLTKSDIDATQCYIDKSKNDIDSNKWYTVSSKSDKDLTKCNNTSDDFDNTSDDFNKTFDDPIGTKRLAELLQGLSILLSYCCCKG
jgi:hypothetical protein